MRISVLKETRSGERRVAATPDTVKKYIQLGAEVVVEASAGVDANITDDAFKDAGANIATDAKSALKDADIILKVQGPDVDDLSTYPKNAVLVAMLNPFGSAEELKAYAGHGLTSFAMEFMPRITRAQSMDVLSSQSNLAGYKSVLDACAEYGRALPMMMTAAGTVPAAKVFIMGAGVAGLQAIATAKRLGAIVTATDVRLAAKEQVESLGGKFIMVDDEEAREAETAGGYAKEMSDEYKRKQAELVASHIKKQDIVITTALIPGRPAPRLITADMIASMRPGSVIVDLAVEQGGNVEGSKPGEVVNSGGISIVGHRNVPSRLAADASALYAKNLLNFLTPLVDSETKKLAIDWEDEIIKGTLVTKDGAIPHPNLS